MDIEAYLHQISKRIPDLFFVEIGAMDGRAFDPLYGFVQKYKWKGVLVEPIKDWFEYLKINYKGCEQLHFENSAITEREEVRQIYRIPIKLVKRRTVPMWISGSSSFYDNRNEIANYKHLAVRESVKCITLKMLFDKYNISKVDVLQIDVEGFDYKVFKQFDFSKFRPYFISIEVCNLPDNETQKIISILEKERYLYEINGQDLFAKPANPKIFL